ncbi:MAG: XdhC family protein [Acidobacteriota bacterium]|nr:XdhC family protein [Acidobacteriota bacterium]MDH3529640.1 XdhC family protein [Acidobacteriota bacterium]
MKETREILNTLKNLEDKETAVLATVADVDGSSFRLPGAKMLILEDGMTVGTVSGGCLEADVLERAKKVRETGETSVLVYDTREEAESVFSLNMGCRGIVRILMEPAAGSPALEFHRDNLENSRAGVIATQIDGSELGAQVIVDSAGLRHSSFESPHKTQVILAQADIVLKDARSRLLNAGGNEFFFEYVPVPTKITIFGGGADAIPLVRLANELGWKTHVIDHRPAYANPQRFPDADVISNPPSGELLRPANIGGSDIAVVMTHNFEHDKHVLKGLLESDIGYIGAMGPKARTARILEEIESEGYKIPAERRAMIHGPVGLDIGATTPEGIALAIASEIQTHLSGRKGGFLRDRDGSIYGRR